MNKTFALLERPDPRLAAALEQFETGFRYPLGKDHWFRISHGEDYTRFFRAIGTSRCFVATRHDDVAGVISVSRCQVRAPDGTDVDAAYLADLKVAGREGRTLLRLLRQAVDWSLEGAKCGFSIVMDGTAQDPTSYTGRLGIPKYIELGKLMILRIASVPAANTPNVPRVSLDAVRSRFHELTAADYAVGSGVPATRSKMDPTGMMLASGNACGILEDTRRCKWLFRDDGSEMVSAHLSNFGYTDSRDGLQLLRTVAHHCHQIDVPAFFVSIPARRYEAMSSLLGRDGVTEAPATVFGHGFRPGLDWSVHTSEI